MKTLTVSVAAYNVAAFLRDTLSSCAVPEVLEDLEVLIVNDGSTDETVRIAEEFCSRYPGTFRLINKENGGYGTTVNTAVREAGGRYFRLLDGDDWFDRESLVRLVKCLRTADVDWVVTRVFREREGTGEVIPDHPAWLPCAGKEYLMKDLPDPAFFQKVGMWNITSRTQMLRTYPFELPAHTLYTDQLFVLYQIPFVRSVLFLEDPLYRYRVGRDEQSVSKVSRQKHHAEAGANLVRMLDFYAAQKDLHPENRAVLTRRLAGYYVWTLISYLFLPPSRETKREIIRLEALCRKQAPDVYREVFRRKERRLTLLRLSRYLAYPLVVIR